MCYCYRVNIHYVCDTSKKKQDKTAEKSNILIIKQLRFVAVFMRKNFDMSGIVDIFTL